MFNGVKRGRWYRTIYEVVVVVAGLWIKEARLGRRAYRELSLQAAARLRRGDAKNVTTTDLAPTSRKITARNLTMTPRIH